MSATWMVTQRLFTQEGEMNEQLNKTCSRPPALPGVMYSRRDREGTPPAGPALFDSSQAQSRSETAHPGSPNITSKDEKNEMNQPDSPNPAGPRPVRTYRRELYVARKEEEPVQASVKLLLDTGLSRSPVVFYFWGNAGLGKTFFLKHLQENAARLDILPLYYCFDWQKTDVLADLASELAGQASASGKVLPAPTTSSASEDAPEKKSTDFLSVAKQLVDLAKGTTGPALLLLLDDIDLPLEENENKRCREAWQQIETQLVEPLVTRRCIVASTGKTKIPAWSRYEIQRRLNDEHDRLFSTFDAGQVAGQIEKAGYQLSAEAIQKIIHFACGIPRLVDLLADLFAGWAGRRGLPGHDTELTEWDKEMEQLLAGYETELIPEEKVQMDLNTLYPLRSFIVETLRYMLPERDPGLRDRPDLYFLSYIRDLDKSTDVISYDSVRRAYVILPWVRKMINQRALMQYRNNSQSSDFYRLHETAASMYWEWAKDTPKVSEVYLLEIIFHRAEQYQADKNIDKLAKALKEVTEFASRNLHARRLGILQSNFATDGEIRELLPRDQWEKVELALQAEPAQPASPAA